MIVFYIIGAIIVLIGISVFFGAPYVPSLKKDVKQAFDDLAPIGPGDTVLDIGSGDGVVLREVSRRGAQAIGYEIHPLFVAISRALSWGDKRVSILWANAWTAPFPKKVTLVYAFSTGRDGVRLARKLQKEADALGKPLPLVCYGNPLPERTALREVGAYYLYVFEPLHLK